MTSHAGLALLDDGSQGWCKRWPECPWLIIPDDTIGLLDVIHWDPKSGRCFYECCDRDGEPLGGVAHPNESRPVLRPGRGGVVQAASAHVGKHRWPE